MSAKQAANFAFFKKMLSKPCYFMVSFSRMNIYSISDLHLSGMNPKPMNIFGEGWEGHFEKICADWREKVGADAGVVIGGAGGWTRPGRPH